MLAGAVLTDPGGLSKIRNVMTMCSFSASVLRTPSQLITPTP